MTDESRRVKVATLTFQHTHTLTPNTHMTTPTKTLGVRMPGELYEELSATASACDTTMSHLVASVLEDALAAIKAEEATVFKPQGIALARIKFHWPRLGGVDVTLQTHTSLDD